MVNILNGEYLTKECSKCPFWLDGTDIEKGYGCGCPFPIDRCEAFSKMREEENERLKRESEV